MAAASVAVARSYAGRSEPSTRWQGPFEYVREFASSAPGCSYRGRETVRATVACEGGDLLHLKCTANGIASHVYQEELRQNGRTAARSDVGEYQGALKADYDTHVTKDVDLFHLGVGANLRVQYRRTPAAGTAETGEYLLDVTGSTRDLVFVPQNQRLEWRRVDPIYEPGPAACGVQGRFNGSETVAMRLLPAEQNNTHHREMQN